MERSEFSQAMHTLIDIRSSIPQDINARLQGQFVTLIRHLGRMAALYADGAHDSLIDARDLCDNFATTYRNAMPFGPLPQSTHNLIEVIRALGRAHEFAAKQYREKGDAVRERADERLTRGA